MNEPLTPTGLTSTRNLEPKQDNFLQGHIAQLQDILGRLRNQNQRLSNLQERLDGPPPGEAPVGPSENKPVNIGYIHQLIDLRTELDHELNTTAQHLTRLEEIT